MLGQMIMPVIVDSGSGPSDPLAFLALLILINLICFGIFVGRAIMWFVKKPVFKLGYNTIYKDNKIPFVKYCIWSGYDGLIDFNTMAWVATNGLAFIIYGSWLVYHLMGGALPFS